MIELSAAQRGASGATVDGRSAARDAGRSPGRRRSRRMAAWMLSGVVLLAACGDDDPQRPSIGAASDEVTADHEFYVPAGTGDRIDAGEEVNLVPRVLTVEVGDVLRIVNDDDRGHTVGAFYVGPGETLTQTFSSPGELSGACSVHPSGEFILVVEA